jgi:hypothetical protein
LIKTGFTNIGPEIVQELRAAAQFITSVDCQDVNGFSLLTLALADLRDSKLQQVVKVLVDELGADLNMPVGSMRLMLREGLSLSPFFNDFEPYYPCGPLSVTYMQVHNTVAGSDPGMLRNGHSPLSVAVAYDHPELINFLVTRGARVNQKSLVGNIAPLHVAALHRNVPIIESLLDLGADINQTDKGVIFFLVVSFLLLFSLF